MMTAKTIERCCALSVVLGLFLGLTGTFNPAAGAEYRFVARIPSADQPIWEAASGTIDLSAVPQEEIVLVLENPTDVSHGFAMPQLQAVIREQIIRPVDSMVPTETVLQYTAPISVTVEPGQVYRVRLSNSSFKARASYSETIAVFCPLHRTSRAGSVFLVK
ncbi:MAG: hypothetical protein AB7G48_20440 [Nitrospiraceae bacterium]